MKRPAPVGTGSLLRLGATDQHDPYSRLGVAPWAGSGSISLGAGILGTGGGGNPYVAKVLQGEGPNATVTINVNGAFFFSMGTVVDDRIEGGPVSFRGARPIQVGPYSGGSFRAQVLALLHEFGHVIDLLPMDRDDYEGRSRQNTADVLRVCRAQVESKAVPGSFLASR